VLRVGEILFLGLRGEARFRGDIFILSGLFRGDLLTPLGLFSRLLIFILLES